MCYTITNCFFYLFLLSGFPDFPVLHSPPFNYSSFFLAPTVFLGPFLVLAFVRDLCPLTGRFFLCLNPLYELISINLLILKETSLLKSPSTLYSFSIIALSFPTSLSVRFLTLVPGLTSAFLSITFERVLPIPNI